MANIANLITKLSGIIASLDDIRDAISQGGGGSSTASGVTVTPVAPLTGTNLQATTNETAALLQDHTDEISALNSRISANKRGTPVDLAPYHTSSTKYTFPTDGYIYVSSESLTSGLVRIPVYASDDGAIAGIYMNITGNYQVDSLYVKKGMKCYVDDMSTGAMVRFRPIVE